ncbi:hypothetical protein WH52_14480 [Tenacibaculum holothuriorum]|uniref:Uncharacterized protein n=1 Tax=Tenacibaculum holothuriorum TaxID=1635173 RepID=A0A1Y2P8W1_9FLAO|nr:zinc-dependent metalloprotease family protein [Tenacibaculum holothuriorum]OSY86882.1 hypothetical protein WH52_14480 [Tenacibaculum holothuriorum]
MKKILLLVFSIVFSSMQAQNYWKKIESENLLAKKEVLERKSTPSSFNLFSLDPVDFASHLNDKSRGVKKVITLPSTKGNLNNFYIKEDSNFENELQKKFPSIKSYSAQGIDDPTATAKISIGTDGVHVTIFSGNHSTLYIDPYTKSKDTYISYQRKSLENKDEFECQVQEQTNNKLNKKEANKNANDGKLRTYRIAIVCSGEYSDFHLNRQNIPTSATDAEKKAAVLSAMNTSMTRINGVYEKDLAVKMVIVSENDKVIFLNKDTDNITDGAPSTMINEVQSICDNVIGNDKYDIGHIFSIGGDGLAGLGVVCVTGQKARGVTGRSQPIGDPYDIDFVSHEIGHQFGATHTQNNNCNRTSATAVEPGSGSTIMGYAGICSPDVQPNSDDYFHAVSIDQMWATIGISANCAIISNTNNASPTINAGQDVSIPKSTPFKLTANANDPDNNSSLTYNWEQTDNEVATMPPNSSSTGGPLFRSLPSKQSPTRYFPQLKNVTGGTINQWEVLPSVAREMNFSVVVRDNHSGGGASARDDIKITITDSPPFTVTAPSSSVTWNTGSSQTITWSKGNTDTAPINCSNVNIRLSTDGGITFPILIKENTPNDGSEDIIIPDNATSKARIMIEASDNIFYNVNSTNFTINSTTPTFILTNKTNQQKACNTGNNSVSYTLNFDFVNGFSETVNLSTTGAPNNSNITFSPSTINSNGDVTMTVSNLNGANQQDYTIVVKAEASSVSQNADALLKILGSSFGNITLASPANSATNVSIRPEFKWGADSNATAYDIKVATNNSFSNPIIEATTNTNSYTHTSALTGNTKYFWFVKPKNDCGEGSNSSIGEFTTENPSYCSSTFTDEAGGSEHITNVTFNTINNSSGNDTTDGYQDFTSISTTIKRDEKHQISVTFDTGGFQDHCYVFIDWNQDFKFDNNTERYDLGTKLEDLATATFEIEVPSNAALGNTRMRVLIEYDDPNNNFGEGACDSDHKTEWGETEDYTIEIQEATTSTEDFSFSNFNLSPNPSNGRINLKFEVQNTEKVSIKLFDLRGRVIESKNFTNIQSVFNEEIQFNRTIPGLYLLQIQNGGKQTTKKLVIK